MEANKQQQKHFPQKEGGFPVEIKGSHNLTSSWLETTYFPHRLSRDKEIQDLKTTVERLETLLLQTLKGWDKTSLATLSDFRQLVFVDRYSWNNGLKQLNVNHLGKYEQIALDICHNYREMMDLKIVVGLQRDIDQAGINEVLHHVLKTGAGSGIKKWFNHHGQKLANNPEDETKVIKRAFDLLCKFGQPANSLITDGGFCLFEQATVREIEPRGLMRVKRDTGELGWVHTNKKERILIIGPRGGLFAGEGDPRESWLTYDQLKEKYNSHSYTNQLFQEIEESQ